VFPIRLLTTTPRQRIVLRREMARQPQGSRLQKALMEQYEYDGIETCAADGSCVLSCPVGIDTGKLIKDFRNREHDERAQRAALKAAKRWAGVERAVRMGLRAGGGLSKAVGDAPLRAVTRVQRRFVSSELMPEWGSEMPNAAPPRLPDTVREGAAAVYVPSCINRMFGTSRRADGPAAGMSVVEAMVAVSARAGAPVWIPPDVAGNCCAVPWGSKGYREGHAWMANRVLGSLWRWTGGGELPVVIDASSCTHGIVAELGDALTPDNAERHGKLEVIDATDWARERLAPKLETARVSSVAVHPTCAGRHVGIDRRLRALAAELADEVFVPPSAACCGFAGDRGFLHPELTASATQEEAAEVKGRAFDAHVSTNRTCELGMERATGRPYEHVVQLLERLSRPA
jgi:D-lactate dehydrogenase